MSSSSKRKTPSKSVSPKPKSGTFIPKLPKPKRLVEGLEANLAAKAQESFSLYDPAGEGRIPRALVITVLRAVGLNPAQSEADTLLEQYAPKADSDVTLKQFLNIVGKVDTSQDTQEFLEEAFRVWDSHAGGHITEQQLRHIMTNLGEKLSEEEVEEMMGEVTRDERGAIKYRDLITLMLSEVV